MYQMLRHFDLSFWKSYHAGLQHTGQFFGEDLELLWQAFLAFCRKDLVRRTPKDAIKMRILQGVASETVERFESGSLVESVIFLAKFFLDRTPPNDNRWGGEKAVRRSAGTSCPHIRITTLPLLRSRQSLGAHPYAAE